MYCETFPFLSLSLTFLLHIHKSKRDKQFQITFFPITNFYIYEYFYFAHPGSHDYTWIHSL